MANGDMKPEDIPLDDAEVYRMISEGDTDGVFQLESRDRWPGSER